MRDARALIYLVVAVACLVIVILQMRAMGDEKAPVLRLPCRVVEVVDGDTVTVEVTLQARVRLLDCWAPDNGTPEGDAATRYVRRIANEKDAVVEVDLVSLRRLDDAFTFGRLLGRIYIDGQDLSQRVVQAGHATATKGVE